MKVLHLLSNSKWTGPAEPALNLCVALRRKGIEVDFACAPVAKSGFNKVVATARDRGIEPIQQFHLMKHRWPLHNIRDMLAINRFLATRHYDLVHCHLDNAHRVTRRAAHKHGIPLIRSSYEGNGFDATAARLLPGTAFLVEPSAAALEYDAQTWGFPREKMAVVPGAVDTERFDPSRELPDGRRWMGIPRDAFVVGIVARIQPHRHYADFFAALRMLVDRHPNVHAIVVERGPDKEDLCLKPVREMRLDAHVHFTDYIDGENYVGMLKAFDVKVYLVPGTDGTCRAVRECMAMAKPVVAADRGMLREIVRHNEDGYICDGSPQALFDCLFRLCANRQKRHAMGQAAYARAQQDFSLATQADQVIKIYESVLSQRDNAGC